MAKEKQQQQSKVIDYLKEDPIINSQKFALVSMLEPKNKDLLMNRQAFFSSHFLIKFMEQHQLAVEYKKKHGKKKLTQYMKEYLDLSYENIRDRYYDFIQLHHDELDTKFNTKYNENDEIVLTGFKIRGTYPNKLVLDQEIKKFHLIEPHVDIYSCPVGRWIPYCPKSNEKITEEYAENKLNNLMKNRVVDAAVKEDTFQDRHLKAIQEEKEEKY